ncbi:MAG TPA: hypothetical protein VFN88_07345, partial [Caulobacteraceae bacterium]|nr:hypothetical protein [Caulobacteraceae bacterium]
MRPDRQAPVWLFGGLAVGVAVFIAATRLGEAGWRAWLGAAFLIGAIPTGALALTMMLRLIPGAWREGLAGPLAPMPTLIPIAFLASLPILIAPSALYPWVHQAEPGFRGVWLTPAFFAARGVVWFAILTALALALAGRQPCKAVACAGLILIVILELAIADDWLMSLDEGFASSGYGLYILSIEVGLALALAIAQAAVDGRGRVRDVLGGVMVTVAALWAYLGFMQFIIVWSGDLPGGAAWYLHRGGAWSVLAWAAIALKTAGAAPLAAGAVRKNPKTLRACALAYALGAAPELAWLVGPMSVAAL